MAISKIKKFLGLANNLTTTDDGYALDARQGKALSDQIANVESVAAYFRVFVVSSKTTFTVTFPAHTSNMYVLLWNNEAPEKTRRLFTNVSIRADGSINYKGDIGSELTITTNTNQMTIKYTSDRAYTFCILGPDRTFMNGITIT